MPTQRRQYASWKRRGRRSQDAVLDIGKIRTAWFKSGGGIFSTGVRIQAKPLPDLRSYPDPPPVLDKPHLFLAGLDIGQIQPVPGQLVAGRLFDGSPEGRGDGVDLLAIACPPLLT